MTRVTGPALQRWLAAAARIAPVTITADLGADHGPDEPVMADRDGDWLAGREEDRMWRRWP